MGFAVCLVAFWIYLGFSFLIPFLYFLFFFNFNFSAVLIEAQIAASPPSPRHCPFRA